MDAPIAPPAPDADGDARAPGTARPGRPQLGGWPLGRRRPAGDAVREPAPAWTIVFGLGLLVVAGIVGWRAWHAPRPPEPFPLRVVDEAGRPVEGAMVALAASPDASGPVERSDADGRLVFGGRRLDRDRKRGADDGPAFATLLPVVPSFGAARVGRRWYRIDPDVPVRRGDVLRLAPVAVATLEARLDTEDGPVVLVDFRRSADDLNAPTIPGDDDGVVRVPVVGADVRGVLVTPDLTNTCASEPLVFGPASEHSRRVVVRADAPLVRLALETADGAPRPLTRRDLGRRDLEVPRGAAEPARPLRVATSYASDDGTGWSVDVPVVVGGDLAVRPVVGRRVVTVRLEGEGWAHLDTAGPLPARLRLRRSEVRVPLASLPDVPPGRVADVVVRGAGLAATVAGRPDRDAIVFVDLPPDAWEIGFRSAADGDTFAPVAWITVGADGRLESGPALERR